MSVEVKVQVAMPIETWGRLATIADNRGEQVKVADVISDLILRETTGERFKRAASEATMQAAHRRSLQSLLDEGFTIQQIAEQKHISMESARRAVRRLARGGVQA